MLNMPKLGDAVLTPMVVTGFNAATQTVFVIDKARSIRGDLEVLLASLVDPSDLTPPAPST
jgi:hypothetical protein